MRLLSNFCLLFFTFPNFLIAQEDKKENPVFQSYPEIKIYGGIPVGMGDNFLNKGHDPRFDFGLNISPFSFYAIKFGIGIDYSRFEVTDASLVGNGTISNMGLVYGYFSYPLELVNKLSFEPKVGIGGGWIQQKREESNFGRMDAVTFNLGGSLEYELDHPFGIFIGTDYFYSKFNVEAPSEYSSFFENVGKLNIYAGLKFILRKKPSE